METAEKTGSRTSLELERAIERYHQALREFVKGDPEPQKLMFSHRDDVTLANPLGPPKRGWREVCETLERAASLIRDGEIPEFENVTKYETAELAYIVELEWATGKIAGGNVVQRIPLRVTTIFRPEDGTWKVVHRQADTVVSPRSPESLVRE